MVTSDQHIGSDIIALLAQGDERAFSTFVNLYWNTIYSHAMAYLKSVENAEETTQDIFMKIWNAKEKLPEIQSVKDYLFIIARNQIFNETRKRVDQLYQPDADLPAPHASPVQHTEFKETYDLLLKGIELLPEQRRKVFKMSRLDGMSNDEIARQLGMHRDTVYQYLVKAQSFLRAYLHDHGNDTIPILIMLASLS